MLRRRYGYWSGRRWVVLLWCSGCLLCLSFLAVRDIIPSLPQLHDFIRSRHCPPPPAMESDSCLSWRSLEVMQPGCGCKRNVIALHDACLENSVSSQEDFLSYTRMTFGNSTCSDQTTLRGPRQHVLVYGAGVMDHDHLNILNETLHQVKELYPGWVVRLYTHLTPANEELLCNLLCQHQHFDLCAISMLMHSTVISENPEWSGLRWWILGDPLVAVWEARKLGMAITSREAHAVTQFINSEKCWHVQRDHDHQKGPLGSGFLGGKAAWGQENLINLRQHLLNEFSMNQDEDNILEVILAPMIQQESMVHSSISCWQDSGAVAFPSKRRPGEWIGMTLDQQKFIKTALNKRIPQENIVHMKEDESIKKKQEKRTVPETNDFIKNKVDLTEEPDEQNKVNLHNDNMQKIRIIQNLSYTSLSVTTTVPILTYSEADINLSVGITTCPGQCRPLMHPDWEYC